jgi:hypothetical protein
VTNVAANPTAATIATMANIDNVVLFTILCKKDYRLVNIKP